VRADADRCDRLGVIARHHVDAIAACADLAVRDRRPDLLRRGMRVWG
jgi:hypothetical protein